jgi:hypothetical protein
MNKNLLLIFIAFLFCISCFSQDTGKYTSLFNGRDLTNWTPQKPESFEVMDGEMVTRSYGAGNDIFTNKCYGNFILRLEFLLSEVGNSGVFIRCRPEEPSAGFEVQLLAPWTPWRDDLHCTGSMYGHVAVKNRPDETTGVWYRMEIKCDRNFITISVNDKVVTSADIDTVKTMAGKPYSGVIGFQGNHGKNGQYAKFRNISIRDLDKEPGYVKAGFYSKNTDLRDLALIAAVDIGADMIYPLAGIMAEGDPMAGTGAKQALFDIAAKASNPEAPEKEKKEVLSALKKSMNKSSSATVRTYLKWLTGMLRG